jgi:hypothetical protein
MCSTSTAIPALAMRMALAYVYLTEGRTLPADIEKE